MSATPKTLNYGHIFNDFDTLDFAAEDKAINLADVASRIVRRTRALSGADEGVEG